VRWGGPECRAAPSLVLGSRQRPDFSAMMTRRTPEGASALRTWIDQKCDIAGIACLTLVY
jgi:hypothetical protein